MRKTDICWSNKCQVLINESSCEFEYYTLSETRKK